jgi:hypothetical protein
MARLRFHRLAPLGLLAVAAALAPRGAQADDVPVPINLQAELLFMIAAHDRNLPARAGAEVRTLILVKGTDDSARAAAQFKATASAKPKVAGLPHVEETLTFTTAGAVAEACRSKGIAVLYLAPGFTAEEAAAIGKALEGGSVLSASASPALVKKGVVLGFDLVSGRAKLLVDLTQAARQKVSFGADVLGLMAVSQ